MLVVSPLPNFLELTLREKNDCVKLPFERVSLSWKPDTLREPGDMRPGVANGVGERMEGAMLGSDVPMGFGLGFGTASESDLVSGKVWVINNFWGVED